MANFDRGSEDFSATHVLNIIRTETVENYTVYEIKLCLAHIHWTVKHRYSEFNELHEKLVLGYHLDRKLLPPKKFIQNRSESFVKKRQKELEAYLQNLLRSFVNVPTSLALFLDFHKYEIHTITQEMAVQLYHKGDQILAAEETFYTTPLYLYSMCARLKLPKPTSETGDKAKDIGHILAFVTKLKYLHIDGSDESVGTSNIVPNQLAFLLQNFKSLEKLELVNCNPSKISGIDPMKKSLKKLRVHNSLKAVKDLLLLDMGMGHLLGNSEQSVLVPGWQNMEVANFSRNEISYIDESIKLLPHVKYLDLSENKLHEIQELQHLPQLTHVDLSYNSLKQLHALHTKFGNIKSLNMAANNIESFQGFSKLYSLESLDASSNEIAEIEEVRHLGKLPCLEKLVLKNNPVNQIVDYRTKVLESFNDRARELCLDGVRPNQKELDTVAVLLAIQKSRAHKPKKPTRQDSDSAEASATVSGNPVHVNSTTDSAIEVTEDTPIYDTDPYFLTSPSSLTPNSSTEQHSYTAHSTPSSSHHHQSSTAAPNQSDSELYGQEVERLHNAGGNAWLSLLNQIQEEKITEEQIERPTEEEEKEKEEENSEPIGKAHSFRFHYDEDQQFNTDKLEEKGCVQITLTESDSSISTDESDVGAQSSFVGSYQMFTEAKFMLPESMPNKNDTSFMEQLQLLIPDAETLKKRYGITRREGQSHREERPVHLMWCSTVRYSMPYREFPAAIYVTTENIHIFEVKALTSDFEIPDMKHCACVPLLNVQQIALGYQNLYIRIEEAFVGPNGTFTFLTCNAGKTEKFLDLLKVAYRRAVPDLDQYEDPHIIVNKSTEENLKKVLGKVEQVKPENVEVKEYMLVNVCNRNHHGLDLDKRSYTCHSLVITTRCVYVLREDYVFWPQPTFSIGPSTRPQFEVVTVFPMQNKILHFQIYDSDTCSPDQNQSLASTFLATNTSAMLTPNFIGYGVKLMFQVSPSVTKELDIRVSTPNVRNTFLDVLTAVRDNRPQKLFRFRDSSDRSSESTCSGSERGIRVKKSKSKHKKKKSSIKSKKALNLASVSEGAKEFEGKGISAASSYKEDSNAESVEEAYFQNFKQCESTRSEPHQYQSHDNISDVVQNPNAIHKNASYGDSGKTSSVRKPKSLNLAYPSIDLLGYLTKCIEKVNVLQPLSTPLQSLAEMTGEEILNLFHSNFSQIGQEDEELRHLLWTETVPYINPKQIIVTCVLLSTKAIYFISDNAPKEIAHLKPPWKNHVRYRSDLSHYVKSSAAEVQSDSLNTIHAASGIVHKARKISTKDETKLKSYCTLSLNELKRVHIGLFDHSFRLSAEDKAENVYCCLTRDGDVTESFIRNLMAVLSLIEVLPSPDSPVIFTQSASEQDFYKMFRDRSFSRSLSQSLEYMHSSKVKFIYPNDDVILDLMYVIRENIKGKLIKNLETNVLFYMLCYKERNPPTNDKVHNLGACIVDIKNCDARTVVLTNHHLTLAVEDYVSYPVPNFAKQPPVQKQHAALEIRSLEHLKRVFVNDFTSNDVTLIFADESEEVIVDTAFEYYTPTTEMVSKTEQIIPEVSWTLVIQNKQDKERFIRFVTKQWEEIHQDVKLSVQVNT